MINGKFDLGVDFTKDLIETYKVELGSEGVKRLLKESLNDINKLHRTICEMLGVNVRKYHIERHFSKLRNLPESEIDRILLKVANTYLEMGHYGYLLTFQEVVNLGV